MLLEGRTTKIVKVAEIDITITFRHCGIDLQNYNIDITHKWKLIYPKEMKRNGFCIDKVGSIELFDMQWGIGNLVAFYIMPNFRGMGIGTKVLEIVKEFAKEIGYEVLRLRAACSAIEFYKRSGFVIDLDCHNPYMVIDL